MEFAVASKKKRRAATVDDYFIRTLSAPMHLSHTGELCSRLLITPGTTLTIGRSKKDCDVVFQDARVSRRHCQLRLLPHSNSLILLDGASISHNAHLKVHSLRNPINIDSNRPVSRLESHRNPRKRPDISSEPLGISYNVCSESSRNPNKEDMEREALRHPREEPRTMLDLHPESLGNCRKEDKKRLHQDKIMPSSSGFGHDIVPQPWKPSLNGIFVNGHAFVERMRTLMPGDEVSLVGPTEAGRSLDSDCHIAVGFVVETQPPLPSTKTALPASSCSSKQTGTDSFSALKRVATSLACLSYNGDGLNHCSRITLADEDNAQVDDFTRKQLCADYPVEEELEHRSTMTSVDVKPGDDCCCIEPDTKTAKLSTESSTSGYTEGIRLNKHTDDGNTGSLLKSEMNERLHSGMNITPKKTSFSLDLDSRLASTLNLVKASIQLRSDMLTGYNNDNSHAFVGQKELLLTEAKKESHPIQEDQCCQKIPEHSNSSMEFTMLTVKAVTDADDKLMKSQGGDSVWGKDMFVSLEHTVRVDSSREFSWQKVVPQQITHFKETSQEDIDSITADKEDVLVLGKINSVGKQGSPLKKATTGDPLSLDFGAKASQTMRTLLVSQNSQTTCVSKCIGKTMRNAVCENPSRSVFNTLQTSVQVLSDTAGKPDVAGMQSSPIGSTYVDDICQLTVEDQIGGKSKPNAAKLQVIFVQEELSGGSNKDDTNVFCIKCQSADEGSLFRGQVANDGICFSEEEVSNFKDSGSVKDPFAEPKVICPETSSDVPQPHVIAAECLTADEGNFTRDHEIGSLKNHERVTLEEDHLGRLAEASDLKDSGRVRNKEHSAEPEAVLIKISCDVPKSQDLAAEENLPAIVHPEEIESGKAGTLEEDHLGRLAEAFDLKDSGRVRNKDHSAEPEVFLLKISCDVPKSQDLAAEENLPASVHSEEIESGKEGASVCALKGQLELVFESPFLDASSNRDYPDQICSAAEPDYKVTKLKSAALIETNQERDCDGCRMNITVTQEGATHFEPYDLASSQNVMVNAQIDEEVKRKGQDSINSSGYCLNQLKDVSIGAHGHCHTLSLQDLLAPIDNIQALFIATFSYDVEWFLSFAGLSRDTPVTVACHNAKRCWSSAYEDRCEKPYLDWPNVTLVYPPFPSSSSFGKGGGIGCHHPKIFLLHRTGSMRVIVSSANLTFKQWFYVTNNVWWQDFPRRQTPDFRPLFREELSKTTTTADFASQLANFLAALLADAPSESHWVTDLATFDFSIAEGSLVASVPGMHRPLYHNAPQFLMTLEKESYSFSQHGDAYGSKHLGIVPTTVAGIRYRFCASADQKGSRIRSLAAVLNDPSTHNGSTMPVLLKRAKFLKADPNAVSVVVTSQAKGCSQDLFLQEDLHNADINTMESDTLQTEEGFIKLGFLPRNVASWLAVLCDRGFFSFAACIWPIEALAVASGQRDGAVKLALYVFQGPAFSTLSPNLLTSEEAAAFSVLLKSLHHTWGLWRLEQVLSKYKWVDSHESDFFFASSSIGTSLDAKFLAAFAAAAGRRAVPSTSQESDPGWGCWTADQEAANPSIGIVFPSIERVKRRNLSDYGLLCFAESAWLRLKSARLLHDAVPYPPEREGYPMHTKVARRRFQQSPSSPPYGWIYCGSHNFSPAAWGRPAWRAKDNEAATVAGSVLGSSLHISNYELGIVFVEPPPEKSFEDGNDSDRAGLDRFVMPFKVPPPIYTDSDRPATGRAMMEAYLEMRALQLKAAEEEMAVMQGEVLVEEEGNQVQEEEAAGNANDGEEAKAEEVYVEKLWSQMDEQFG